MFEEMNNVDEPQLNLNFSVETGLKQDVDQLNVLSLFSGCGGMDLGFEGGFSVFKASINEFLTPQFVDRKLKDGRVQLKGTRFKTVFANDILKGARNAWINYFQGRGHRPDLFHTESIVDLVRNHQSGAEVFPRKVDVVTGGFPCQDFSVAGKRKGFNSSKNHRGERVDKLIPSVETRGKLYMWMKQVIEITKPKIFIAENVKGLVNLDNVKEVIQSDFSSAGSNGYLVLEPKVLSAADYGVPQSRERVIFIGIKRSALKKVALKALTQQVIPSIYDPYPKPTHSSKEENGLKKHVALKEILSNLDEPEDSGDPSHKFYSQAKFMGAHCQGQVEIKLNGLGPTIRAEHHGNIEFRRLSKKNGGRILSELKLGLKERRLTPRECALIQTFPLEYEFVLENSVRSGAFTLSPSEAYRVIGNAVPPLLAYNIARRLEEVWDLYFNE